MNDYLGSLAERALGLTPVVRPRLASIFEPVRLGPSSPHPSEPIATDDASSRQASNVQAVSRHDDRHDDAAGSDWHARRPVVNHREQPSHERHPKETPKVVARSHTVDPRVEPQEVAPHSLPPPHTPVSTQPRAPLVEAPLPRVQARHESGPEPTESTQHSPRSPARVDTDLRRWRDADQRLAALERRREPRTLPREPSARRSDHEGPVRFDGRDREAPTPRADRSVRPAIGQEPARAVHVTIGRVEVRAIVPPEPAPRSRVRAAKAASLSLDDYLKTRSGR